VHFLGLLLAAERFPERRAVVEVVGDDRAVAMCGLHGFQRDFRSGGGKRAENSARVQPAGALLTENVVPIDVAGLELRDCGVSAIVAAGGGAYAEAAFGEVEAIARG